jgi:hypothetical protein
MLGEEVSAAAWAQGGLLTFDQATAAALEENGALASMPSDVVM